jgi:hypothetical protein
MNIKCQQFDKTAFDMWGCSVREPLSPSQQTKCKHQASFRMHDIYRVDRADIALHCDMEGSEIDRRNPIKSKPKKIGVLYKVFNDQISARFPARAFARLVSRQKTVS